jgi:hypothetical protein
MQVSALRPFISPFCHQQQRVRLNASIELYSYFFGSLMKVIQERSTEPFLDRRNPSSLQHIHFIIGSQFKEFEAVHVLRYTAATYGASATYYWIVEDRLTRSHFRSGACRELWSHLCDSI